MGIYITEAPNLLIFPSNYPGRFPFHRDGYTCRRHSRCGSSDLLGHPVRFERRYRSTVIMHAHIRVTLTYYITAASTVMVAALPLLLYGGDV